MVYRKHLAATERIITPERHLNIRHEFKVCDRRTAEVTIYTTLVKGELRSIAHCSSCGHCKIIDFTPQ